MIDKSLNGLRCVGLTRCSSKGQAGEGLSNDQQLDIITAYAAMKGMVWCGEERAEGVSGSDTHHRPDLDNLFTRAETKRDFDALLVQSFDRLTRGGADHGAHLIYKFAELGVIVISASNDIPQDDEYASVIRSIEFIKGEGTAKSISLHSARGSTASILAGRAAYSRCVPYATDRLILSADGTPLFRIRNYSDGTQRKLHVTDDNIVIEFYPRTEKSGPFRHFIKGVDQKIVLVNGAPDAVEDVRLIYDWFYTKGIGAKTITEELNRRGGVSPRGKSWNQTTVYSIVMNPIYVQRGIGNATTCAKFYCRANEVGGTPTRIKKKPINGTPLYRPESDWIITKHPEITIIRPELHEAIWEKQYEKMLRNVTKDGVIAHRKSRWNSKYLLHGAIFDRKTGVAMTPYTTGRHKTHTYRYYANLTMYNNPHPDLKGKRKFVSAAAAEKAVLECFTQVLGNLDEQRDALTQYAAERLKATGHDAIDIEKLRAERLTLAEKKAFALDEFGDLGPDLLRKKIGPMTARLKELDLRISTAERSVGFSEGSTEKVVDLVMKQVRDVAGMLGEPSSATLRSALQVLTRTVADAETGEAEIELRVPEEVWRHPTALQGLCAVSSFPTRSRQDTQHRHDLILAKFHCKSIRVRYAPCFDCKRQSLKAA